MATITPFPTAHQREVLRQLDSLAADFRLPPERLQRVKARYLATEREGRSTAVAVAEARREMHGREQRQQPPGAA